MADVPEATLQVCDSIWTRGHIFQFLLSVANIIFSDINLCLDGCIFPFLPIPRRSWFCPL